jgi:hypothetical protein
MPMCVDKISKLQTLFCIDKFQIFERVFVFTAISG